MKNLLILFLALFLFLSVCGCGSLSKESDISSIPSVPTLSTNETSKITEDEAIEIASQYWNIKSGDIDAETGFRFLIMPVESSNDNFAIALKWLVDNHHYSTVDSIEIDPYTGRIVNTD